MSGQGTQKGVSQRGKHSRYSSFLQRCLWLIVCSCWTTLLTLSSHHWSLVGKPSKVLPLFVFFNPEWSYKDVRVIPQLLHKKRFDIWLYSLAACHYPAEDLYSHVIVHLIHGASNSNSLAVFLCTALQAHQQSNKLYFFCKYWYRKLKDILPLHYYPLLCPRSFSLGLRMQRSDRGGVWDGHSLPSAHCCDQGREALASQTSVETTEGLSFNSRSIITSEHGSDLICFICIFAAMPQGACYQPHRPTKAHPRAKLLCPH